MAEAQFRTSTGPMRWELAKKIFNPQGPSDVSGTSTCDMSSRSEKQHNVTSKIGFLSLPIEIRLLVYHWLHLMSPVRHAQLAPWYPSPVHSQYRLRRVKPMSYPEDDSEETLHGDSATKVEKLLSPYRPLSALPTNLLRANSQIYHETRLLPFKQNEFVFVNWFASGLWAAYAFTRALEPWQRSAMRFVRLEILARDVIVSGNGREEWHTLCDRWADGLRGLRMKIVLGSSTGSGRSHGHVGPRADAARQWVVDGVGRMPGLETLEMEVVAVEMGSSEKMDWCELLERDLREVGLKMVEVICTEKAEEKMEWIKGDVNWKGQVLLRA